MRLVDFINRFLGTRPIRLKRVIVAGKPALLALSSRMWLNYVHQDSLRLTPLIFDPLDYVSGFTASLCPNGFIGLRGSTIKYALAFILRATTADMHVGSSNFLMSHSD